MNKFKLKFDGTSEIQEFISVLNASECTDNFSIESEDGKHRSNARSFLGVFYAFSEFPSMYLVNDDNEGHFPSCVLKYGA